MPTLTLDQAQERVAGLVAAQEALQAQIAAFQDIDNPDALATLQGRLLALGDLLTKAQAQEREAAAVNIRALLAEIDAGHADVIKQQDAAHHELEKARLHAASIVEAAAHRCEIARAQRAQLLEQRAQLQAALDRLTN